MTAEHQPPSAMEDAAELLFEEARQRARQRHRRVAALVGTPVALMAAAALVLTSGGADYRSRPSQPAPATAPWQRVLARAPYMGVACPTPNSIACDRVGLAVWTRRPARAVSASIAGRSLQLDDPDWSSRSDHGLRRVFAGFLQHAGLQGRGPLAIEAGRPVRATVRVVIIFADGTRQATTVRVGLAPGWG